MGFFARAGFCRSSNFTNLKLFKIVLSCKSLTFHVTERAHFTYEVLNFSFISNRFCKRISEFNTVQEKWQNMLKSRKVKKFEIILNFDFEIAEKWWAKPSLFFTFHFENLNNFKVPLFFVSTNFAFFPEKCRIILKIFYKICLK